MRTDIVSRKYKSACKPENLTYVISIDVQNNSQTEGYMILCTIL